MNFYRLELKKFFRSPLCLLLGGIFLLAAIVYLSYAVAAEPPEESGTVYGVLPNRPYAEQLEEVEAQLAEVEREFELYAGDLSVPESLLPALRHQKKELMRTRNTLLLLEKDGAELAGTAEYPALLPPDDPKSPTAGLLFLLSVLGGVCALVFSARTAWRLPAEQQNGQSKLTMLLPCGRTGYCLRRLLADLLCAACLFSLSAVVCALLTLCFLGGTGNVVAATEHTAVRLNSFGGLGVGLALGLCTLFVHLVMGFCLSLCFRKPLAPLLFSLLLTFLGLLPLPLGALGGTGNALLCSFFFEFAFLYPEYRAGLSLLFALLLLPCAAGGLLFRAKRDV